jgi:hypothetical protein
LISKTVYNKYLVRKLYPKNSVNDILSVIDNNSEFQTLNLKYIRKNSWKKKEFFLGSSVLLDNFVFQKKQFQFKLYSLNSNNSSLNYLDSFFQRLRSLRSSKKALILVKPQKGGVFCYFNGINSFFPFKQFFQILNLNRNNVLNLEPCLLNKSAGLYNVSNKRLKKLLIKLFQYSNSDIKIRRSLVQTNIGPKKFLSLSKLIQTCIISKSVSSKVLIGLVSILLRRLNLFTKKRFFSKNFSKLNFLLLKNGRLMPRILQSFIFYKLRFKVKSQYYNGILKRKTRNKKKKKRFFRSSLRIIFLSYISKTKK